MYTAESARQASLKAKQKILLEQENLYSDYIKATEVAITTATELGLYAVALNVSGQTSDAVSFMVSYLRGKGFVIYNEPTSPTINWEQQ